MTLALALTNLRDRLDEPTAGGWTDATLRRFINEAVREVSRRSESLRTSSSIAVVAGTRDYTGPTDAVRIHEIYYNVTGQSQLAQLRYMDLAAMGNIWGQSQATERSAPVWWTTWGTPPTLTIRLFPVPAQAGSLTVYYYKLATELATDGSADSSSLSIPAGWEDVALDYAEYRAFIKSRQPDLAALALQRYSANFDALVAATTRFTDQAGAMIYDDGYDVGGIW